MSPKVKSGQTVKSVILVKVNNNQDALTSSKVNSQTPPKNLGQLLRNAASNASQNNPK